MTGPRCSTSSVRKSSTSSGSFWTSCGSSQRRVHVLGRRAPWPIARGTPPTGLSPAAALLPTPTSLPWLATSKRASQSGPRSTAALSSSRKARPLARPPERQKSWVPPGQPESSSAVPAPWPAPCLALRSSYWAPRCMRQCRKRRRRRSWNTSRRKSWPPLHQESGEAGAAYASHPSFPGCRPRRQSGDRRRASSPGLNARSARPICTR